MLSRKKNLENATANPRDVSLGKISDGSGTVGLGNLSWLRSAVSRRSSMNERKTTVVRGRMLTRPRSTISRRSMSEIPRSKFRRWRRSRYQSRTNALIEDHFELAGNSANFALLCFFFFFVFSQARSAIRVRANYVQYHRPRS